MVSALLPVISFNTFEYRTLIKKTTAHGDNKKAVRHAEPSQYHSMVVYLSVLSLFICLSCRCFFVCLCLRGVVQVIVRPIVPMSCLAVLIVICFSHPFIHCLLLLVVRKKKEQTYSTLTTLTNPCNKPSNQPAGQPPQHASTNSPLPSPSLVPCSSSHPSSSPFTPAPLCCARLPASVRAF